jgi:ABC-type phosphate transport system substrate-binding protein
MIERWFIHAFAILLLVLAPARPATAQKSVEAIVAVVHATNTTSLSPGELKNIFLGRKKTWSSGAAIRPFIRPPKAPAGLAFFRTILKMTPARFRHHWQEQELSGQGTMPKTLTSASAVIEAVGGDRGAVSFLTATEAESAGDGVRIVKIQ